MTELFLIAHKVRGEPAFDIAERMPELDEGDELAWIIPTSGHRAHPFWHIEMSALMVESLYPVLPAPEMPIDIPDHYPTAAEPRGAATAGHGLLARLGMLRKTTIKRRV